MDKVDCIVIGAGVVGLAIARELALRGREVVIIEANQMIGNETSSRNNEVLHAGFLYPQRDLRARFCRTGAEKVKDYCRERGIDCVAWGKLVLALNDQEEDLLQTLMTFGEACGVEDLELLGPDDVRAREPEITCQAALYSPSTAVVDTHTLMLSLQGDAEANGAVLALNSEAVEGRPEGDGGILAVKGQNGDVFELQWSCLVNSAGLGAHKIADLFAGNRTDPVPDIHFAKGNFFSLSGKRPFDHIVVPLGDTLASGGAFTIDPGGQGKFGPDLEWVTERDYTVAPEKASRVAEAVGRYWDGLDVDRLQPSYAGIRPRTYGPDDAAGDWHIETEQDHGTPGLVNLLGIETPGLTASMALAEHVADQLMY